MGAWWVAAWACDAGCRTVRAEVQGVSALSGDEQGATTSVSSDVTLSLAVHWAGDTGVWSW